MDSQLKKGLIEYCVLASLVSQDSYGYEIVKQINHQISITESTLYPILKRLETSERVTTYSKIHQGRVRKYYQLTEKGFQSIEKFLADWQQVENVQQFIQRSVENEAC
ncbi:transcriptional regulator [Enterococcus florum]|uniref:Transcriptional regulator n=1 Tax=Enterococcus florum TaxID=2480627 RepID=A0A4P5PA07_9ENTE|nr:PadR family transcriptional regulator [Enterococcus florum]GCF94917.1 transcriptional regulator [Enterococcus florum]